METKDKNITPLTGDAAQKYPGSEMTIVSINEMGQKMEKIILDGLPEPKLFSDAEIVLIQFVGAMICGSLRQHNAIKTHINAFCSELTGYSRTWIRLDQEAKAKAKTKVLVKPKN